ncbi:glycosyl hydrolase family 71-domain-containing protein [Diplogelasinospora grovesii]|uniref:Glycosyl hydrolase family 71-domain-containing protein n=1 Tax=Diplogelasinospora grovesii TaxID=303347 RepID=A0AAN6S130_9PEZI|nr:glycosyl hydrolase family 71-domain-containing protein [Diplogelasinospora grovesii]
MLLYLLAVALLGRVCHIHAKAVFAHFMVSNAVNYSVSDWEDDIKLAASSHITAFTLNMAYNQDGNAEGVADAFIAAANQGFQLFFSFNYAGNGA